MADTQTADSGAISIDQAVQLMELPKKEPEAPVEAAPAKVEGTDSPAEPTADDASGAETQTEGEAETEQTAEAEGEQPEQPAIEPPKFWDAEAKKRFGEVPRDMQEIILAAENQRNAATSRSMQEAAERRKALEAETAKFTQLTSGLDPLVNQVRTSYKSRWEGVDWDKVIDTYGADQALKLKNQMESEGRQLQQLEAANAQANQIKTQRFVAEETAKLPVHAPELADPKLGQERKRALGDFLIGLGAPQSRISEMSALEVGLAYDAMKWRNGQTTAKKLVETPKPAAPAKKAPVKPGATAAPGSSQQARINTLSAKRELSIDEAVELATLRQQ